MRPPQVLWGFKVGNHDITMSNPSSSMLATWEALSGVPASQVAFLATTSLTMVSCGVAQDPQRRPRKADIHSQCTCMHGFQQQQQPCTDWSL